MLEKEIKYSSDCFVVMFFSMPSKVIIIVIQLMFMGINIFRLEYIFRAHFNPRRTVSVINESESGAKH